MTETCDYCKEPMHDKGSTVRLVGADQWGNTITRLHCGQCSALDDAIALAKYVPYRKATP